MKLVNVLAAILVAGFLSSHVNAQVNVTGVQVSPNLVNVNNQQGTGWTGTQAYTGVGGGTSGGNKPGYNSTTNTIYFGYTQSTASYTYALNQALRDSGMTILGYNYSWSYYNQDMSKGNLTANVNFAGTDGTSLHSKSWTLGTTTDWTKVSGTENFGDSGVAVAGIANFSLSFSGKDSRYWAGYYGPMVKDPSITLNYSFDQCSSNPLSSPKCPGYAAAYLTQQCGFNPLYSSACTGFTDILTSQNIVATSYAINQALGLSGSAVKINGFKYGYDYVVGGTWCSVAGNGPDGCSKWEPSAVAVGVVVTDKDANTLYSNTHSHNEQNTSGSFNYSYVFPKTKLLSNMGDFTMADSVYGTGAVTNKWSNWQYTPDPCVVNPLSSTTCEGYAAAIKAQQCAANPLFATDCPGYAAAYTTQQCTISALYDPSCPGYAAAYLVQQCSINPLYSTTCDGYEKAYHDQQCSINALYAKDCTGYAQAYHDQQCSINALYMTDCIGYAQAYFKQQCDLNGLYDRTCSNYAEAYAKKMVLEQQGIAGIVATAGVIAQTAPTTTSTTSPSTSVGTDGTVSTTVSKTGDANVDKTITPPPPATNSAAAPTAPVQLAPPPPPAAAPQQAQGEQGRKPEQRAEKKDEPSGDRPARREDGPGPAGGPQMAQQGGDKPAQPTVREALAERRQAAARAEAVEKGKNLANEMGKVADMEQQKQIQNVVIQAMGFTPGFDVYAKAMLPDVAGYKPFTVYNNQRNVDNQRLGRSLFGPTDRLHNEMVDSQYKKE